MRKALWPDSAPGEHEAQIRTFFEQPGKIIPTLFAAFVSQVDSGSLTGFIELSIRPFADGCETQHVGFVEGWYVDPSVRRRGVGRALVQAGEQWARQRGCQEFASDADLGNTAGHHAHLALGFAEVERRVCYRKLL